MTELLNANPVIHEVSRRKPKRFAARRRPLQQDSLVMSNDAETELIDQDEVFELIRNINDPEHPLTLEQLNVTQQELIDVKDEENHVLVKFVPTIPHCSMATLIGLCIRVKLLRSLPERFKLDIYVKEGSHASEDQVNKQLNDKERVAAAMENPQLLEVVNNCLATTIPRE